MEDCEREWPLGVAGIYNFGTGLCECPPGYTGRDFWYEFNDCHLSIESRRASAIVQLVSCCCVLAAALYFSFQMYQKFDANQAAKRMTRMGSKGYQDMVRRSGYQATMHRVKANKVMLKHVVRRQRTIMLVYGLYILSILCSLPFKISLLTDPPQFRYTTPVAIDFFTAVSLGCYFSACSIIVYLSFVTLPNVDVMGKLLGINSVYIRHPRGVERMTVLSLYCYAGCTFFVGVVFPQLENINENFTYIVVYGYIIFFLLGAAELCCRFAMVSHVILQLFNHALAATNETQGMSVSAGLQRAKQNTKGIVMLVFTGPFALGQAAMLLSQLGLRMCTVFWTGLQVQLDLVLFFFCFFLSRELVGMQNKDTESKIGYSKTDLRTQSSTESIVV